MRRILFVSRIMVVTAVMMMASITMTAQEKELSRVRHIERNLLMAKGDSLTIVNLYLEWPEVIMGYTMPALQEFLCRELFGCSSRPLDDCIQQLTDKYGTSISQMPEREGLNVKYRSLSLVLMIYEPFKYFSGKLTVTERDNKSVDAKDTNYALFTYNIIQDKVLRTADILDRNYMPKRDYHPIWVDLMERFMPRVSYKVYDYHLPNEVCLLNRDLGVMANIPNDENHTFGVLCYIPMGGVMGCLKASIKRFINEKIEKLPKKKMAARQTNAVAAEVFEQNIGMPDSLHVYTTVDKLPEFKGGKQKMADYFASNMSFPEYEQSLQIGGQLLVRFVVRSDGSLADPEVLVPISPGIDRAGVKAIMAMPRWTPAQHNGKDVSCYVILPLNFKIDQ